MLDFLWIREYVYEIAIWRHGCLPKEAIEVYKFVCHMQSEMYYIYHSTYKNDIYCKRVNRSTLETKALHLPTTLWKHDPG